MSTTIDQRIVEMQFDNKRFESNVQTSLSTIDKLKQSLNLTGASKGLENVNAAAKDCNMSGLNSAVETLHVKFSALEVMAVTAFANITNSALNAGKRIVSALTIDPIKTGFSEYETKINAIQTILTNTSSKGTTLDDVNNALSELNTYADKTIYNFSDMTRSIGTFTAAGVDLKASTESIKGIANLAAGSGSSSQQASVAMYQLSQAMATGTVRLMDWNSVVNAGMGGELFQKALEKTAVELGHGRNMSESFRDSLQDGWLTTEVLTKTLENFANDPALVKAATQVKTFTQLFDTMKESVQSGWAISWENIIGNKEEAAATLTALNDAFNNLIGPATDARNAMLQFWHDNGGRDALIEAITNAFKGLSSIITPIKQAFSEIFPPMTGQRLVEITKGIRDLTASFKIGDETSANLKSTFKGLFAVLDIGKQAVTAIASGLGDLIKYLLPAGDYILSFTGSIGNFIVSLDEAIKTSDAFNKAIEKVGNFLKPVADGVKTSILTIIDVFKSLGDVNMSGLDTFSERVKARFEPFTKLGDFVKGAFDKIAECIQKVVPVFYKLASIIGDAFERMQDNIINALDNAEFNSVFDIINGGLFAGILLGLKKFIDSLTKITKGAGGFIKSITGILNGVKGCLKAFQSELKAGTLLKIATAIGVLAASLFVLAMIDSEKLTSSLTAMGVLMAELFGSMGVFEKIMGSKGFKGIKKVATSMIALSIALLILSKAMKNLAELDWNGIAKGLTSIAAMSAILVGVAKSLSQNSGSMIKGATGFVIFAAAILVLTEAVKKLGALDATTLTKGLIGVGVVITELALFMKVTDLNGMGLLKGAGILLLAIAVNVLAIAVGKFGAMDTGAMIKGLAAVGVVLAELAIFVNLTGNSKRVITTAIGLTILGAAMLIFAQAIGTMGNMSWEQLGKGLLTMAASLAIVVVAMNAMPKNMVASGVGLVAVAAALVILSDALQNMGSMSWEEIAKGLITLAASLTIIAVAMAFMKTALPGAAALLVIAGALAILAPILKTLGEMSMAEIGKALLTLVGVFVVLGASALVLTPLVPVLFALGAAIALLGVGALAVGVGLLAFSAGLSALAVAGTAGAAAIVLIVTSLLGLIPMTLKMFGEGIIAFAEVIAGAGPTILAAITTVLTAFIDAIIEVVPKAVNAFLFLITSLLESLASYIPQMVQAGMNILIGFLQGIADNVAKIVSTAIEIVVNFIEGIASMIPNVIQAGFDLILSFINGLANAIRNNTPLMIAAVENLMSAIIEAGWQILTASISGFKDIASKIMNSGFIQGIKDKMSDAAGAAKDLVTGCIDGIKGFASEFIEIGGDLIDGFVNGIKSKISAVTKGAADLGKSALNAIKSFLGIHSPSKEFAEVGMYSAEGLAGGLNKFSGLVATAATNVGTTAKDSLKKAVSNIADIIDGGIDTQPTIRPVLDLSDVETGTGRLNTLFSRNQAMSISTGMNRASGEEIQNGENSPNNGNSFVFTQNNYSPKALSRVEIYRQTKNQFSAMKGLV